MTAPPRPCVYLVTDRRQAAPAARTIADELTALDRLLDEAILAGVDVIQVRERDLEARSLLAFVTRLHARARDAGTRVLVNDRAGLALAAGVDGVHLPFAGLPPARVRTLAPEWIVGRSLHPGAATPAAAAGADYVLFGTVRPSVSKPAGWTAAGLDALGAAVRALAPIPVMGIGGMTPATAASAAAAGAAGAAAIGLFLPPPRGLGPRGAVEALREALGRGGDR